MPSSKDLKKIILGSRQSDLARIQAYVVADELKKKSKDLSVEFYHRPSFGDLNLDMDLKETNSKGVFTSEFQNLLKEGVCDLVVHSWKDLPIEDHPETQIFTLKNREDQRDFLFLKKISRGKRNIKLLTSSPRREYTLQKHLKPFLPFDVDVLSFEAIRGNIPTRFSKFLKSDADGFVVAKAAVDRLMETEIISGGKYSDEFKEIRSQILDVFHKCHFIVLPLSVFPTAAAQGALALEILKTNPLIEHVKKIADSFMYDLVEHERVTHKQYGGGCHQAMGFSSYDVDQGVLFYTSGTHKGESFQTVEFKPYRVLNKKFKQFEIFLSSSLNSSESSTSTFLKRKPLENPLANQDINKASEVVVTRFDAYPSDLKLPNGILWAAGLHTWKKLAQAGHWVSGTLDSLGLKNKPDLNYLNLKTHYWFTNKAAPEEGAEGFKLVPTYDVTYEFNEKDLKPLLEGKQVFFWTSGQSFESVLKLYPEILNKIHFCGLGRTSETLKKHLSPEQIYFCLDENDFRCQVLFQGECK